MDDKPFPVMDNHFNADRPNPHTISTQQLLENNCPNSLHDLIKNDSEIMKSYDLNESNLKSLKQLRKCFSFRTIEQYGN